MRTALIIFALVVGTAACGGQSAGPLEQRADTAGWTAADTVTPDALVRELAAADRPVVASTGPAFLYRTGHIPGAVGLGPTSTPEGFAALRAWANDLPRSTDIVVYCGCCPLEVCPNLKPAFTTLRAMGFTRVRVLLLPTSFGADWAGRGLPIER